MPPSLPSERVAQAPKTLIARITDLVQAYFTGLSIESHEPEEANRDLTQLCRSESWRLGIWDCDSGLRSWSKKFRCQSVRTSWLNPWLRCVLQTSSQPELVRCCWSLSTFVSSSAALKFCRLSPARSLAANIAERFDGEFLLDLPGREQKDAIWAVYLAEYGLDDSQPQPDDTNWTGAEIKSCRRLASLLDVPLVQATQNVVPPWL
jgi:hypothetical protein